MLRFTRRSFLIKSSLAACAFRTRNLFAFTAVTPAVVRAPSGTLRGESREGVRVFRGVPFAEPPVGALRFVSSDRKSDPMERRTRGFALLCSGHAIQLAGSTAQRRLPAST
jgi:hypothetical protein